MVNEKLASVVRVLLLEDMAVLASVVDRGDREHRGERKASAKSLGGAQGSR